MFVRTLLLILWVGMLPRLASCQMERAEVNLAYVSRLAQERATKPFQSPRAELPEVLRQDELNYDNYRKIRFRHDRALWLSEKLPFRVEFFHPGYIYQEPVRIFEFTKTHVQRIRFVQDFFDYSDLNIQQQIPSDTGYAGFKIAYPLNTPGGFDEVAVFLGASYFRMLGKDQRYGLSARGLALDCGQPDRPEQFPIFTDFWIGKPALEDKALTVFALMDSPSCTGAFEFQIRPGSHTVADVEAVLIFREAQNIRPVDAAVKPVDSIGHGPLTSMFLFGENSERRVPDYRPEVHDSDGLLIHFENGEVVWRPLDNPVKIRHSLFATQNPRGFGLLQRDHEFSNYEDMFNLYQKVPSVWIRPKGDWGEGAVHLVELNAKYEGFDNVVVFWEPKLRPPPLTPWTFGYQILWGRELGLSANRVQSTRVGPESHDSRRRQIHIDFAGPLLDSAGENEAPLAVVSCTPNARIYETQVLRNSFSGGWRVLLKFEPLEGNQEPVDLRCTLKRGEAVVSETWAYLWSIPQVPEGERPH